MQSIELQAKSIEEARKLASEKLGVGPEQVRVTVLEETTGLFGKSQVRVRAEVASQEPTVPVKPEPKPKPKAKAEPKVEAKEETAPEPKRAARAPRKAKAEAAPAEPESVAKPVVSAVVEEPEVEEVVGTEDDVVATQEDATKLREIVNTILKMADLEASARVMDLTGRYVNLEIDGKDVAYLVGKHGEVLNAFQYLLNVIGNRQLGNGVRVTLDGNHYRERREEALMKLATQIAEQVRERGEEAVLDALPAFERRVVHKALQGYEGVNTYSEGEEPNRRVVIAPAG